MRQRVRYSDGVSPTRWTPERVIAADDVAGY
jgi:hypothetical protein